MYIAKSARFQAAVAIHLGKHSVYMLPMAILYRGVMERKQNVNNICPHTHMMFQQVESDWADT